MRALLQRSLNSTVEVNNQVIGKIDFGLVVLVGFTDGDNRDIIDDMIEKIINLRIFDDEQGVMNKSLLDIKGQILSVSQFTLYADATKGRRPNYIKALNGTQAKPLYDYFNQKLLSKDLIIGCGQFGAEMKVNIINDGPVTIMLESR
ncbi:MAG: D-aminoacyl-tRNA deacylase [Bacilli bacterium]|nr:D-aminoacyl-tRNA deacylase [Bacilli bacterium]